MIQLLRYMMKHKCILAIACICAVLTSVFSARATIFLKPAINDYIVPWIGKETVDFSGLVGVILKMAFYDGLAIGTLFLQNRLMTKICHETICGLRQDMFEHMQHLPVSYFDTNARGKIISAYSSDINTLNTMLGKSIPQLINGVVLAVSILVYMLILDVRLTFLVVGYIAVAVLVNRFLLKNTAKYSRATQESMRDMNGFVAEVIDGQSVIKVNTKEKDTRSAFERHSKKLFDATVGTQTYMAIIYPIGIGMSNIGFALVVVIGALMVIGRATDIGTICTFIDYYRKFYTPVSQISTQMGNVFAALAGAARIFMLLNEDYETDEGTTGIADDAQLKTGIKIEDMSFSYTPGQPVLKNLNLNVIPGQKVAFVGSSGAGKTTIANLINRFYDVDRGSITIDGTDIREIRKEDLRSRISIVLQETHLFTGTIRDNIRFGRLDATDEEVEAAARLVNADFFIRHLPDGYDTFLESDGDMLSVGQRQLLAIARAAVSKAPILIMDEATSSIDTRTEQLIEQGLSQLMEGRTVFMIAHRLSTVRHADIIVVLKNGEIVECGSHEELMDRKGMYYDLNTGSSELL